MRKRISNAGVTVQAIAGNHAIYFGLDLEPGARDGCVGFAVHRVDHTENQQYWLSSFKTFQSVVPVPSATVLYSTLDHPIQSFYWGDYTAKPGHAYTYRFLPRYGQPKNLQNKPGVEATVDITTNDPSTGTHGVFFNRGVAASQAYTNKFGASPDHLPAAKRDAALTWLSRGLVEALTAFIGQANSDRFALRAAVYEFTQPDILAAFQHSYKAGADVKIVYHAKGDSTGGDNETAITDSGIDRSMLIKRTKAKIAHNKFIVLCTKDGAGALTPVQVWTGSTNISEGGIFGHSNVGHAVRDPGVAEKFLAYWDELSTDPATKDLRTWMADNDDFDAKALKAPGVHTLFSPRSGLDVLQWYADQFGSAKVVANITQAFGMGQIFEDALTGYKGKALHFVSLNKVDDHQKQWSGSHQVFVAVGSSGNPDELARWAKEHLTGFNPRVPYLHTKILLVDPLSDDPTVVTGSANFSPASTNDNDENMLIIRGDTDVADVYFTEFARIFNHFYARWWASQLSTGAADAEVHSFLAETPDWQKPYFVAGNPKSLQRTLFSSHVQGNT